MATKRTSTAARVDAAFKRVVEAQRKHGFPQWETANDVRVGTTSTEFMQLESKDRDQIKADMAMVLTAWQLFPWHNAGRVPVKEPRKKKGDSAQQEAKPDE